VHRTIGHDSWPILWVELTFNNKKFLIGGLYHPPKPVYNTSELFAHLEHALGSVLTATDETTVVLAGDFNQLPDITLCQLGLHILFDGITHAGHCLDRIYCSELLPDYQCKAVLSTIATSHKAVIACANSCNITDLHKVNTKQQFRMRTPDQHAAALSFLSQFSWTCVLSVENVQEAFDTFYHIALNILNTFYPVHTITISNRDPHFVTPRIKALLRHRNRLMHRGLTSAAEALTKRIGARITEHNRTIFSQSPSGNKEMWELVRKVTGKDSSKLSSYANQQATAEQLNKHFAEISRDFHYESPLQKSTAFSHNIYSLNIVFSECLTK